MQHELYARDVEAARRHVGRNQNGVLALAELLQAAVPGRLADVAVKNHARHGLADSLGNL